MTASAESAQNTPSNRSCGVNIKLPPLRFYKQDQGSILYKVPVSVLTLHPCTVRHIQYKSCLKTDKIETVNTMIGERRATCT